MLRTHALRACVAGRGIGEATADDAERSGRGARCARGEGQGSRVHAAAARSNAAAKRNDAGANTFAF
eukprot:3608537-Pleurochrysis_carterae.AAC.2